MVNRKFALGFEFLLVIEVEELGVGRNDLLFFSSLFIGKKFFDKVDEENSRKYSIGDHLSHDKSHDPFS